MCERALTLLLTLNSRFGGLNGFALTAIGSGGGSSGDGGDDNNSESGGNGGPPSPAVAVQLRQMRDAAVQVGPCGNLACPSVHPIVHLAVCASAFRPPSIHRTVCASAFRPPSIHRT
eukprot:355569-Chlamydomonas_euryale.AAC.1